MTGRDLIIYILQNGLEDVDVFSPDGTFFMIFETEEDYARKHDIGVASVRAMIELGMILSVNFKGVNYIVADNDFTTV